MDPTRFDFLTKWLVASPSRRGLLGVLGMLAGLLALFVAPRGAAKEKKSRKKTGNRKAISASEGHTCPPNKKNVVCHCPEGQGGAQCRITCVGSGGGHDNHRFDCMCAGSIAGVPDCDPDSGRCPKGLDKNDLCGGPTTCAGTCTKASDCPFNSVPGCTCNTATGQCLAPPVTCSGACAAQATCTAQGADCVCRTLQGTCGGCITDRLPAGGPAECCSGQSCAAAGVCGPCVPVTCTGACANQEPCAALGATCVCLGLGLDGSGQGSCGACVPDGSPAGGPGDCCTGSYCPRAGICGPCPPLSCAGACGETLDCLLRGGASCRCVGGSCQH